MKSTDKTKNKSQITRVPILPDSFVPSVPQDGDEYFPNGIFFFNITRMIEDIENNRCKFQRGQTDISVWSKVRAEDTLEDGFVESADLSKPVIIAEIAPDRLTYNPDIDPADWKLRGYNLLDGHHRIEKATRLGIKTLDAYILPMESHIYYLYDGFNKYVEYWNDKYATYLRNINR